MLLLWAGASFEAENRIRFSLRGPADPHDALVIRASKARHLAISIAVTRLTAFIREPRLLVPSAPPSEGDCPFQRRKR
jgi:hypothetical protein